MSEYQKNEREKAIELIKNGELFENSKAGFIISRKGVNYPKEEILLNEKILSNLDKISLK